MAGCFCGLWRGISSARSGRTVFFARIAQETAACGSLHGRTSRGRSTKWALIRKVFAISGKLQYNEPCEIPDAITRTMLFAKETF